jgi:metal-responsive CopG/Arc/MetJ family transcriptional regulator
MITFTSSLPDDLLQSLNTLSGKLSIPKNKIIEKALRIYIDQINRAEYIQSFKNAGDDIDVLDMAEEGMEDYFKQLD